MAAARRWVERLLLDGHLWVSLAAAGLTLFAATALELGPRLRPAGVVFAATLLIYAVDEAADRRGGGHAPGPARVQAAVGLALLVAQLWSAPVAVVGLVLAGAIPALLYGVPIRGRRLRDLPGVKPGFVTAALCVAVVAVPWAWQGDAVPGRAPGAALALGLTLFALLLANVCLFDVRDLGVDAGHGVRTVAVRWGASGTRRLCLGLGLLVAAAAPLLRLPGAGGLAVASPVTTGLATAGLATAACAWHLRPEHGRLAWGLAIDGIAVALGLWAWAVTV